MTYANYEKVVLHFLLILVMCKFSSAFANVISSPSVITTEGEIYGRKTSFKYQYVDEYLGIPYAKPPIGELRFKRTEPPEVRQEPLKATSQPPACPQYSTGPFPWYDDKPGQNEDCLYLNLWVPAANETRNISESNASDDRKSVIFFIFGGGFTFGSIRDELYDGKALASTGDVIVVTVSYRLGASGFLNSGTDDAPGNVGIYDVFEGLKWVRKNIESFGGNKNKITLMGDSAGSVIVGLFAISPLTKNMYKRSILQSGTPAWTASNDNTLNFKLSQKLAEKLGCSNDSQTMVNKPKEVVECLRGIDAMKLAEATALLAPESAVVFLPQYGDKLIPRNPRKEIIRGNIHNSEFLMGNVKDEGSFHLSTNNRNLFGFFGNKPVNVTKTLARSLLKKKFNTFKNSEELINYYLDNVDDNDYNKIRSEAFTAIGDFGILCPTLFFAEKALKKNNVFYYYFIHRSSTTPWATWQGVAHYSDVSFDFGQPLLRPQDYQEDEQHLSLRMMKLWTDFAKTGNPGDHWPLYREQTRQMKLLSVSSYALYGYGPHLKNCNFLRKYFDFDAD